jgi:D-sedoheptulose 7-phosphate isomerase
LCISTSGNSKNIIEVLKMSKKMKIPSICFLGNNGGLAKNLSNVSVIVPSKNVARIQEAHIFLGHYIFEQVENKIINKNYIFK